MTSLLQQFCLTIDDSHPMTMARDHIQESACAACNSRTILELGSHQGFSTAAIAIANPQAQVISVDLCDTIPQEQRVEYWNKLGIKNIFPVNADAASYLAMCLRKRETFDFIFHDALHGDRAADEYISCSELTQALAIHDWEQLGSNWLRLDPTPGSDDSAEGRSLTLAERAREWMDYGDYLWMNYVVGLDRRGQQEAIYSPLSLSGRTMRQFFTLHFRVDTLPRLIRSSLEGATWREVFSQPAGWLLLSAVTALGLAAYGGWRLRRALARWLKWLGTRLGAMRTTRRAAVRRRVEVAFYEQLEALLARHGIRRPPRRGLAVQAGIGHGRPCRDRGWGMARSRSLTELRTGTDSTAG